MRTVFGQAPIAGLAVAKLTLQYAEGMFTTCTDACHTAVETLECLLLQEVNTQHLLNRHGLASATRPSLGIVGSDAFDQLLPMHHLVHLPKQTLPLGLLAGATALLSLQT